MSSNCHILALESDIEILVEVLKPLKALPPTLLANVGGAFDVLDPKNELQVPDTPLKDLCE